MQGQMASTPFLGLHAGKFGARLRQRSSGIKDLQFKSLTPGEFVPLRHLQLIQCFYAFQNAGPDPVPGVIHPGLGCRGDALANA